MHDPMTLAFSICRPWPERRRMPDGSLYWPEWIQIWHVDPEVGGDDDSCDWFGNRFSKENGWYPGHVSEFELLPEEAKRAVQFVWWQWRRQLTSRPWWRHPRWHIWHWEINVLPLLRLKRWLFSRCKICGKRFTWADCCKGNVISQSWHGSGPAWFRNAENIVHAACDGTSVQRGEGGGPWQSEARN